MQNVFTAIRRLLRDQVGWHRIGIILGLLILGVAGFSLYHRLHGINLEKVMQAMAATPSRNIIAAAAFVAAAYATFTMYDFFALRTIGYHRVPYRIAALAAFTSYAIGHNIGATVFTGGAVRLRIYSAWGLSVIDVAKIAFVSGLTFWLGNAFVLGLGVGIEPASASPIDHLPAWLNRGLAVMLLLSIASYLVWLANGPRVVGRDHWEVKLPSAQLTLLQVGIGFVDLMCSGLAMYMLLPDEAGIDLIRILVTFVMSTLLGFASHVPGGLGVFDASMLVSLWQYEPEQLLAALLLFRLLYYLTPFTVALLLLGSREVWIATSGRARRDKSATG